MFEIVIDLFASPGSEHRQDSCGSGHRQDSRVQEAHVYTQHRDRARPLKRRVEVSMRNLTREDRDAFTAAKQKQWASWLDKEAVELAEGAVEIPRSHILRARWVPDKEESWHREGSKSSIVRTWISGSCV